MSKAPLPPRFFLAICLLWAFSSAFSPYHRQASIRNERTIPALFSSIGDQCGISYEEPVFRPPAEWRSLILQVTVGCSWNRCTFCEMYQDKDFRVRAIEEIAAELKQVVSLGGSDYVRDVFLADGDAMTLPTGHLEAVLTTIRDYLPKVRRVSCYCLPRNIRGKSVESLSALHSKGLSLVYVGCESGENVVLSAVKKGETYQTSLDALKKLSDAGIKRSVMILLGLGGKEHSERHAMNSAKLCSNAEPEYLSVLTTSFPRGKSRVEEGYDLNDESYSTFQELSPRESIMELEKFLSAVNLPKNRTIFRSDHPSNYLVLKGRLGRDREKLLSQLRAVLDSPPECDEKTLRPEWARGL